MPFSKAIEDEFSGTGFFLIPPYSCPIHLKVIPDKGQQNLVTYKLQVAIGIYGYASSTCSVSTIAEAFPISTGNFQNEFFTTSGQTSMSVSMGIHSCITISFRNF